MNVRQMRLEITTKADLNAMHQVAASLTRLTSQFLQFLGLDRLVRTLSQTFIGFGEGVQRVAGIVGKALTGINVHVERLGALFRSLRQDAQEGLSGLASGLSGGALGSGERGGGLLSGLLGIDSFLNIAQAILGPVISAVRAAVSLAARGFELLGKGVLYVAKSGVDMNLTLESARISLTRLAGGAGVAGQLIAALRKEAITSSLTFKEMLPIAQSLTAAYGPQGIGRVLPALRAFGDTAAALRVGQDGLNRALLGFRQLLGKPFAQQEELNQIAENLPGFNVSQILRRQLGTADAELLQKAGVTGAEVAAAILQGMQEQFGGSQAALGNSLPLILSGIEDTLNDLWGTVTEGLTQRLTQAAKGVLDFLNSLSQTAQGQLLVAQLTAAFDTLGEAVMAVGRALPGLVMGLGPLAAKAVEGVAGLVKALAGLLSNPQAIQQMIVNIAAAFKTLADVFAMFTGGKGLGDLFDPAKITKFLLELSNAGEYLIKWFFGLTRAWEELVKIFQSGVAFLGFTLKSLAENIGLWFQATFASITRGVRGMVADALSAIADGIQALYGPLGGALQRMGVDVAGVGGMRGVAAGLRNAPEQNLGQAQAAANLRQATGLAQILGNDPHFGEAFGKRMADAFTGKGREDPTQQFFLTLLDMNRRSVRGALFGGGAAAGPPPLAAGMPPPHMLYGQGHAAAAQVLVQAGPSAQERVQRQLTIKAVEDQVKALDAGTEAWAEIVKASQLYAKNLESVEDANLAVLPALLGQLGALDQLTAGERQLLALQKPWTKEWYDALKGVNQAAEGVYKVQDAVRELLFDTKAVQAATQEATALFQLGKDAGFGQEQMQALAAEQEQLLGTALQMESARLSTLTAGTEEWHKQRLTIISTVGEIVKLRKQLDGANSLISRQSLVSFRAATPFGVRGTGPEVGIGVPGGQTELGGLVNDLLGRFLNPEPRDLMQAARETLGAGGTPPWANGEAPGGQPGAYPTYNVAPSVIFNGPVNDVQTIQRIAAEAAGRAVEEAFARYGSGLRDRNGRG
jgi:tape measure domain-containing protein